MISTDHTSVSFPPLLEISCSQGEFLWASTHFSYQRGRMDAQNIVWSSMLQCTPDTLHQLHYLSPLYHQFHRLQILNSASHLPGILCPCAVAQHSSASKCHGNNDSKCILHQPILDHRTVNEVEVLDSARASSAWQCWGVKRGRFWMSGTETDLVFKTGRETWDKIH